MNINEILGFDPDTSTMSLLNELTSSIPGIDEAMCLGYIMKIVNQLDFSCVVFDTAPTGHTLRLLNFPNLLGKGLEKMISLKAKFSGIFESVGNLVNQNLDNNFDRLFHSLDQLKSNIEVINAQFKDNVIIYKLNLSYFIIEQNNFYCCLYS
jgi:arsenite-transporting ATPase